MEHSSKNTSNIRQEPKPEYFGRKSNNTSQTATFSKRWAFVLLICTGVLFLAYGLATKSSDIQLIPAITRETPQISDANATVSRYDRSNFNSTEDHIQDLQRSIPITSKIKAFNGASLSDREIDATKDAINSFNENSYDVSFVMVNVQTGKGIAYNTDELFYSASAIKAPYIVSLLAKDTLNEDRKTDDNLNAQIESILLWSDNDAYDSLDRTYDTYAFQTWGSEAGLEHILELHHCYQNFTSADLAKMWLQIYCDNDKGYIDEDISQYAMRPETSSIHSVLSDSSSTWSKAGWIPFLDEYAATNDAGIIKSNDSTYVMAICSNAPANFNLMDDMVYTLSQLEKNLI